MKLTSKNLRSGEVKLLIESAEDLWYLSQIIEAGDTLFGKTPRKIKTTEEGDATKRMVFISLAAEKIDYTADSLRVSGKILEGPDDVPHGSYHTFAIEAGSTITLVKPHWYSYQLDRLTDAIERKRTKILICLFDREEAFFALVKSGGTEVLSHLKGEVERKRMTTPVKTNFYSEIIKTLEQYDTRYKLDHIILASPSFWKEELFKVLRNEHLRKKIITTTASAVDESALPEVIRRDEVRNALSQERISQELHAIESLLSELAKSSPKAVYGLPKTEEAAQLGAIQTLLLTDAFVAKARAAGTFSRIDSIMRAADKNSATIIIVSEDHDGGKKLRGLGGIAALLRYALSE